MDKTFSRILTPPTAPTSDFIMPHKYMDILLSDPQMHYFFNISLPHALKNKETLGHILLICPDSDVKNCFISLLNSKKNDGNFKFSSFPSSIKQGDLVSILTDTAENDILIVDNNKLSVNQECIELIRNAMSDFSINLIIGKGNTARSIKLDLPHFTVVMCVEKNSTSLNEILHHFDYIFVFDEENLPLICKAKIQAMCPMQITDGACEYLSYKAKYNVHTATNYLKRILEYMGTQKINSVISQDLVEQIFNLAGLGVSIENTVDDDEIIILFSDIKNCLHDIHKEICEMRKSLDNFIDSFE